MPKVGKGGLLAERVAAQGYDTLAVPFAGKNEFLRRDLAAMVGAKTDKLLARLQHCL